MQTVYEIIQEVAATSSTKEKQEILKRNANNDDLKNFLRLVYDTTSRNFYISEVDNVNFGDGSLPALCLRRHYFKFEELADQLSTRFLSGNRARDAVSNWWRQSDVYSRVLLEMMIERDIRAGVGVKTINKVWPGLIPVVPYMRCSLPSSKGVKLDEWDWAKGIIIQTKEDAQWVAMNVENGKVTAILSRNGTSYPLSEFSKFFPPESFGFGKVAMNVDYDPDNYGVQIHGEMIVYEDGKPLPREKSNGVITSIERGESFAPNQYPVYVVWDVIPLENAKTATPFEMGYEKRLSDLALSVTLYPNPHMRLVKFEYVFSWEQAMAFYQARLLEGLEGAILKKLEAIWKDGDSVEQVKMKVEKTVDLRIIGKNPGKAKGKHKNTFGSLQTESDCQQLEVAVTGFKDAYRQEIHDMGDKIIGAVIEVISNGIMWNHDDPNKKPSLFLPRCKTIRFDKDQCDDLERIKAIFAEIS